MVHFVSTVCVCSFCIHKDLSFNSFLNEFFKVNKCVCWQAKKERGVGTRKRANGGVGKTVCLFIASNMRRASVLAFVRGSKEFFF